MRTIEIINELADRCEVTVAELHSSKSAGSISLARHLCWKVLRDVRGLTYRELGDIFNRNTSTIITAVKRVNGYLDTNDKETVDLYNRIKDIY